MRCSSRIASPILRSIRATTTHLVLRVLYHSCSHSCNTKFSTKTDQNARIRHNSTRYLPFFFFFCLILEENRLQARCQLNKISILSNWRCCAGGSVAAAALAAPHWMLAAVLAAALLHGFAALGARCARSERPAAAVPHGTAAG